MIQKIIDDSKCRLCLSELQNEYSPIFSSTKKNVDCDELTLSTKIMICLSLPVQYTDSLSKNICIPCKKEVTRFHSFRERCHTIYHTQLSRRNNSPITNALDESAGYHQESKILHDLQLNKKKDDRLLKKISTQEYSDYNDNNDGDDDDSGNEENEDDETDNAVSTIVNVTSTKMPTNNEEEIITISNQNTIETVECIDQSVSYKCFHCGELFSDLNTATNHCMKCTNIVNEQSVNEQLEEKQCKELFETIEHAHGNSANDEEKIRIFNETDKSNSSIALPMSDSKLIPLIPKCRKQCHHTKCRRSIRRQEKIMHSCPQCDKSFASACLLKRHIPVHTGERPFECDTCGRRFSQVGALNFHKKFHFNPPYSCKICNKPFMRPSDMEKHMRTHTGEKPFSCQICQKQFAQTTAVQQHERIHSGAKPYICEICGKAFSQSGNKRKHVLIHKEGTKPHACETCGRSFSDLREMELHKAGHGGGRPRECDYCGDRFRKLSEISDHIRRYHTFERPHKCAFCTKAFYALYSLKQHIMIHTGQKPYTCKKCDHKFTQKGNLAKHYARKHSDYSYVEKRNDYDDDGDDDNDDYDDDDDFDEDEILETNSIIKELANINNENKDMESDKLKELNCDQSNGSDGIQ